MSARRVLEEDTTASQLVEHLARNQEEKELITKELVDHLKSQNLTEAEAANVVVELVDAHL